MKENTGRGSKQPSPACSRLASPVTRVELARELASAIWCMLTRQEPSASVAVRAKFAPQQS